LVDGQFYENGKEKSGQLNEGWEWNWGKAKNTIKNMRILGKNIRKKNEEAGEMEGQFSENG
jgi:hypothetical protein